MGKFISHSFDDEHTRRARENYINSLVFLPSLSQPVQEIQEAISRWKEKYRESSYNDSPLSALYSFSLSYNIKHDITHEEYILSYYERIQESTKIDFLNYEHINSFYEKITDANTRVAFDEGEDFIVELDKIIRSFGMGQEEIEKLLGDDF